MGKIVNIKSDYTFHIIMKIYILYKSLRGPSRRSGNTGINVCKFKINAYGSARFTLFIHTIILTPNIHFNQSKNVTAITAGVFCICVVNWNAYQGNVQLALSVTICVSLAILLIVMLMLSRLPQAIENLSFKVWYNLISSKTVLRIVRDNILNLFFRCLSFLSYLVWA